MTEKPWVVAAKPAWRHALYSGGADTFMTKEQAEHLSERLNKRTSDRALRSMDRTG